jgi:hypothetical protein
VFKKNVKLFFLSLAITTISSPKPTCGFSHSSGWSCASYSLTWINEFFYDLKMISKLQHNAYSDISIEYGFDLFIVILISLLVPAIYIFVKEKLIKDKPLNKRIKVFLFLLILLTVRFIFQVPYKIYPRKVHDWREQAVYRPISGGYD